MDYQNINGDSRRGLQIAEEDWGQYKRTWAGITGLKMVGSNREKKLGPVKEG